MSQENVEVVLRALEAVNRDGLQGAIRVIDEVVAPDAELRAVGRLPDADTVRGREAAKKWFGRLLGALDWHVEADEVIDAGDEVVVVARQTSRGKASGAEVVNHLVLVWGVRRGKVTYLDAYRTKNEALAAVGLSE